MNSREKTEKDYEIIDQRQQGKTPWPTSISNLGTSFNGSTSVVVLSIASIAFVIFIIWMVILSIEVSKISNVSGDSNNLGEKISTIETKITNLEARVAELSKFISVGIVSKDRVDSLEASITQRVDSLDASIKEIDNRIHQINSEVTPQPNIQQPGTGQKRD